MKRDISKGIVAIVISDSFGQQVFKYEGTGFLTSDGILITCGHVLHHAKRNDDTVYFRYGISRTEYAAKIEIENYEADIAVLKPEKLPDGIETLPLLIAKFPNGHPFSTYGYPQKHGRDALHARGTILGYILDNEKHERLQITTDGKKELTKGYSGAPIWDESLDAVVGVVKGGFDETPNQSHFDTDFAITISDIKNLYPALTISEETSKIPLNLPEFQIEPWIQPLALHTIDDSKEMVSFIDALSRNNKMILAGNSGSGKTYTLKIAANELNQDEHNPCLWVPLISYSRSLAYTIKTHLGWHEIPDDQVISELQKNKIVLLLDGLNEVTREQDQCVQEIRLLLDTYQAQLCVSYPITDLSYFGFNIPAYTISPLSENQIEQTIKTFFAAKGKPGKADWFLQTIRYWSSDEQEDFDALAKTPIYLQHLLELGDAEEFTSNSIRDLYGRVIQKRLTDVKRLDRQGQISIDLKVACLMELAYTAIAQDQPFQLQKDFVILVFSKLLVLPQAILLLDEIKRVSLLIPVNDFILEWPHGSFQDYLAGKQLFNLIETGKSFDDFPIETSRGVNAAAHATRLLTTQSRNIKNRPAIFLALLKKSPKFEILKTVAEEFYPAIEHYQSLQTDLNCDEDRFTKLNWGERFLSTYHLIETVARKNEFLTAEQKIPVPDGLSVDFDNEIKLCLILFSGNKGIKCEHLDNLDVRIANRKKKKQTTSGFCLPTPLLFLLDPEIIAYLQVGVWLFLNANDKNILTKWNSGLASFLKPPKEWIPWEHLDILPETEEICANPQETQKILQQHYGVSGLERLKITTDILIHSDKTRLSWSEIYMPVTFQIEPTKIQDSFQPLPNRVNQIRVQKLPDHHISLLLLMPPTSLLRKVDNGIQIFVPFPVTLLHRYYYLFDYNLRLDISVAHLRG